MVLVACEESQAVTKAMRRIGIEAFSCDIEPCSGGHPEWHIQGDVVPLLKEKWDMILAFPPCTHLAASGAAWFDRKQKDGRQKDGIDFFMRFTELDCFYVAIENPIGIMSNYWKMPTQIIHPWHFGHPETKGTCLWLKNLPKLVPTNKVELPKEKKERMRLRYLSPSEDRSKLRSKTFEGVACAMAEQWGSLLKTRRRMSL